MQHILECFKINKTYYTEESEINTIDNISFNLNSNEFLAIIGPSGCGKSTLLSIINKQENYNGKIKYFNNKIGYMLQEDALLEWLTVFENATIALKITNAYTKENVDYVNLLLKKYGLEEFKKNYPDSLSGGMRQRVALIRTLATKPDILLMDEPFSALDAETRINIADDIYNILRTENKSLIIVTHDIGEAISISDRIMLLTKRPSKIKKEYELNFNKEILPSKRKMTTIYNKFYNEIREELKNE